MDIKVKKLCDIDSVKIPEELLSTEADECEVDAALESASLRYARESSEKTSVEGDILYCDGGDYYSDGREVLIFTGTAVPGAEKAALDGVGKTVGESFLTKLFEDDVKLTVKKVIHRTPAVIDGEFVRSLGIDGVNTPEQYRAYIKKTLSDNIKSQKIKQLNGFFIKALTENSEFSYDEAEMKEYVENVYAESLEMYGEELAAEDPDEIKKMMAFYELQGRAVEAFCKEKGLKPDLSELEADVDRMLEMASLTGEQLPPREELIESEIVNAYIGMFFEYTEKIASERIEA